MDTLFNICLTVIDALILVAGGVVIFLLMRFFGGTEDTRPLAVVCSISVGFLALCAFIALLIVIWSA